MINKFLATPENKDFAVSLDSTPVYIKDTNNVIFPKEMSIVFPLDDMQYQINALSEVYMENDLYFLNIRNLNKNYDHAFFQQLFLLPFS